MDTDRLRYFCTVAKTASIHRASELLHISPAALSKAIKLLESEVSMKLLVPAGRGIAVTDDGKAFAVRAEKLLSEFESLKASGKPLEGKQETLRIGSFEVFTTHALGPLLKDHLQDVNLELHELVPGKLEEALANQTIDIGITYIPIPRPDIDFLKVATITMGVFSLKGPLLKMPLEEMPFAVPITPIQGSPTKVVGLDGWPDNIFPRNLKYKVTLMESALELCRQGLSAIYVAKFVIELHNKTVKEHFHLIPYTGELPIQSRYTQQPVYIVKRRSNIEDRHIKQVARALRLICH